MSPLTRYEVVMTTHLKSYAKVIVKATDAREAMKFAEEQRRSIREWFTDPVDPERVTVFAFKELPPDEEDDESLRSGRALVQRPKKTNTEE